MAGVDLDGCFSDKSKVRIEMDVVIEDLFGDSFGAKRDQAVDALADLVDVAGLQPGRKLLIDRSGPFLEDEGGTIEV